MAFLRLIDGLWLLGAIFLTSLRCRHGPNLMGAYFDRHFCGP